MSPLRPTFHPRPDDQGVRRRLDHPSRPSPRGAWEDPLALASTVPDGPRPGSLAGLALVPWTGAPATAPGWAALAGEASFLEPPLPPTSKARSAGAVIVEPDGRIWTISPSNGFGGYTHTFPKGRPEDGLDLRATALREAFEETGLRIVLTGWLVDAERTTTWARYYLARRVGGDPAAMGWESQAVNLVPRYRLARHASHPRDRVILEALDHHLPPGAAPCGSS